MCPLCNCVDTVVQHDSGAIEQRQLSQELHMGARTEA